MILHLIKPSRARAGGLGQVHHLTIEGRFDKDVPDFSPESEAGDRIPVRVRTQLPELEARIARDVSRDHDALDGTAATTAEDSAVDQGKMGSFGRILSMVYIIQ